MNQFQTVDATPIATFETFLMSDISVMISGLTFSILSVLLTVINGVNVGYVLATNNFSQNLSVYLPLIVDSISWLFALVGALLITKMEIRLISVLINRKFDEIFSKIKVPLKDLILTVTFIIILLLVGLLLGLIP